MKQNKLKEGTQESWYYFGLVGTIGYTIALPLAGGALIGSFVDKRLLTYPTGTLLFLLLGFVVSLVGLYKTMKDILQKK